MKKIVINNCFGGFSLSLLGQQRYLELIGKKAYFFTGGLSKPYKPTDINASDLFVSTFTVPNPNEVLPNDDNWHQMTSEEKDEHNRKYNEISFNSSDLKRDDPLLIQVVEELGEKANGRCAELKIVEIPDDVEWEIDEYDGSETIDEVHRSWN